jgi:hypothetical protein
MSVHELIGQALHALTQRLECHCHTGCGKQRQDNIRLASCPDQRPDADHDHDIYRCDEHSQSAIHQCLIDHEVDVVQAVFQNGQAQGEEKTVEDDEIQHLHARPEFARRAEAGQKREGQQYTRVGNPLDLLAFIAGCATQSKPEGGRGQEGGCDRADHAESVRDDERGVQTRKTRRVRNSGRAGKRAGPDRKQRFGDDGARAH